MSTIWAAVRKNINSGCEWVDPTTADLMRAWAADKAEQDNMGSSGWADTNPVVRIAEFELREIKK